MNPNPLAGVVAAVGQVIDDLHTSDKERLDAELDLLRIDAGVQVAQIEANSAEAAHRSLFIAGWRPAIGWVGAGALGYQFLLHPLLLWIWPLLQAQGWLPAGLPPPTLPDTEALWVLLSGLLGIAGLRSVEKVQGVAK